MTSAGTEPARRTRLALVIAMGFAAAFCVLYLGSTSKWWYEDDPTNFAAAAAIANPIDIFCDPQVLHRWGTGASLVPMDVLSCWIDVHLFGISATGAHLHNLVSTLVACWLLYVVLTRFGADRTCSAFAAGLWVCLPATIAVHLYLGPRHYLEGLAWGLAACYVLHRICHGSPGRRSTGDILLLLICALAAMLSKEIYVTTLPAFLFLYALWHRRYIVCVAAVALVLAYAGYRLAILGPNATYPHPDSGFTEYLRYLRVLPYTFSASPWGWAYYGCLAAGVAWAMTREPHSAWRPGLLLLTIFVAGLIATYPTAPAVLLTYETPGTWYRAVFISQTIAWIAGAYFLGRYADRRVQVASLCILIAILGPGVAKTRAYWEGRLARSEAEGRFYLAHPERLVYSEEDADWFLPGLERLYAIRGSHYVSKNQRTGPHASSMLAQFSTIWRHGDGPWVKDDELYALIRRSNVEAP